MAKGLGLIGNYSGKVGNTIGYVLRNSKNKQTQGIRVYQPVVRNPQSTLQMQQRIKIAAVSNIYRQFKDVIRRSMENQEYGDASRRAWLRQALGSQFSAGPWLLKGTTTAYPIPDINMSVGSLPDINVQLDLGSTQIGWEVNRASSTGVLDVTTVGALSQLLIYEGNVVEGDQVTILAGSVTANGVAWGPVRAFYVSTASSTPLSSLGLGFPAFADGDTFVTGDVYVGNSTAGEFANVVCLITSRDGDGQHLRNTARFVFASDALALLEYSPAYRATAIESYRTQESKTEDWQVTRAAGGGTNVTVQTLGGSSVVLTSLQQVGGYLMAVADDGSQYYIFGNNDRLNSFHSYLTSYSTRSTTAPSGASNANTIGITYGANAEQKDANFATFTTWFVREGGSITALM